MRDVVNNERIVEIALVSMLDRPPLAVTSRGFKKVRQLVSEVSIVLKYSRVA